MTKEDVTEETRTDEGARSFAAFLSQVDDGCLHAETSEELHKLMCDLQAHAARYMRDAKGEMHVAMRFAVSPQGTVTVVGEVKTKTPKAKNASSIFWLNKANNLVRQEPRQQRLPLHALAPTPKAKDLPAEDRAARTI